MNFNPIIAGDFSYGIENIKVYRWDNKDQVKIGKFCSIADNCKIYLGGNHRHDWYTTYPFGHIYKNIFPHTGLGHPHNKGALEIGNDVWIAANVTIMSGVKIGNGAVLANNSHVIKDVKPYTIVGGNPAKLIKNRFDQETVDFLQNLKWWDLPINKIQKIVPLLCDKVSLELNEKIRLIVEE